MKKVITTIATLALIGIAHPVNAGELETVSDFSEVPAKEILDSSKTWSIKLSTELDPSSFNNDNEYVVDENGDKLTTFVQYIEGTKEGVVSAPSIGYEENVQYTLVISDGVASTEVLL